jgi:hypothetical protein
MLHLTVLSLSVLFPLFGVVFHAVPLELHAKSIRPGRIHLLHKIQDGQTGNDSRVDPNILIRQKTRDGCLGHIHGCRLRDVVDGGCREILIEPLSPSRESEENNELYDAGRLHAPELAKTQILSSHPSGVVCHSTHIIDVQRVHYSSRVKKY